MKDKQQISKEIRREIKELNIELARLSNINKEHISSNSLDILLPAIIFIGDDAYTGLKSQISELIGKCEVCKDLLRDKKLISQYDKCVERLKRLESII